MELKADIEFMKLDIEEINQNCCQENNIISQETMLQDSVQQNQLTPLKTGIKKELKADIESMRMDREEIKQNCCHEKYLISHQNIIKHSVERIRLTPVKTCIDKELKWSPHFINKRTREKQLLPLDTLDHHMKILLKQFQNMTCTLCSNVSNSITNYGIHFRLNHHGHKPFYCHVCNYGAFKKYFILAHFKMHFHLAKCDLCEKTFQLLETLRTHYITVHLGIMRFECHMCPYKHNKETYLDVHINNAHASGKESNDIPIVQVLNSLATRSTGNKCSKRFVCGICRTIFTNKYALKRHIDALHVRKYILGCDECAKTFLTTKSLEVHANSIHHNIKQHECKECNFHTACATSLKRHVTAIHLKIQPFSCDICNQNFPYKRQFKIHFLSKHSEGPLPFQCTDCSYSSTDRYSLNRHNDRVHLKIKKFDCPQCAMKFPAKGGLKRHVNIVHLKLKPFFCAECDYKTSSGSNLRGHIKRIHQKVAQ